MLQIIDVDAELRPTRPEPVVAIWAAIDPDVCSIEVELDWDFIKKNHHEAKDYVSITNWWNGNKFDKKLLSALLECMPVGDVTIKEIQ